MLHNDFFEVKTAAKKTRHYYVIIRTPPLVGDAFIKEKSEIGVNLGVDDIGTNGVLSNMCLMVHYVMP